MNNISIFYFIGRLNPPHNGHISALIQLINMSKAANNSVPLILLGNGPKLGNPLDNPISFELKKNFINYKLSEKGFVDGRDYIIKEMTNPATNVSDFIIQTLEKISTHLESIQIIHIAGGKDEDASKLDFIKKFAFNAAFELKPDTNSITVSTEVVEPLTIDNTEMSATRVRKDAYKNYLNGKGLEEFLTENGGLYAEFYGSMAPEIYAGITEPCKRIDRINVEAYLDPSIIISGPKTKRARISKGGYYKHKHNTHKRYRRSFLKIKTLRQKRRRTNKNKNRTKSDK